MRRLHHRGHAARTMAAAFVTPSPPAGAPSLGAPARHLPIRRRLAPLGALALWLALLAGVGIPSPAPAREAMQCRSVNGNVTCASPGAVSCQTVNGRTTCVSGAGGVVQSFGPGSARITPPMPDPDEADDADDDEPPPPPRGKNPYRR